MLYLFTIQKPRDEVVDVDFPLGHDVLDRRGALDVKEELATSSVLLRLSKPKLAKAKKSSSNSSVLLYLSLQIPSTL
jgi:hypothetical protein